MNTIPSKPYDARLAAWLVAPLVNTAITPNHLTCARAAVGCFGAVLFGLGDHPLVAALVVALSNFLDHTDGELARLSGKMSRFGHFFDLVSDALVTIGMFVGIGVGLVDTLGARAAWMGGIAGFAIAGIFQMRYEIESREGKAAISQPRFAGFEAEDVLYLVPLVVLAGGLALFLRAAAIGAPLAFAIVFAQYVMTKRHSHRA